MKRLLLITGGLSLFLLAGVTAYSWARENGDGFNQTGVFVLCAVLMAVGTMMLIAGGGRSR